MKAIPEGEERDDTCDHGLYVQKLESKSVRKKKITRRDDQSAISSKEHVKQVLVRSNTNLFFSYVPTRSLALDRQMTTATESGTTATIKHTAYILFLQKVFSGKKTPNAYDAIRDECMPLTGFFRGYCRLTTIFAWRSFTTGGTIIFPFVFCVENLWYTLAPCHKICHRQKAYSIVCNRASLCVFGVVLLVRTCIACTRAQTMSICPNLYNTTLEALGT